MSSSLIRFLEGDTFPFVMLPFVIFGSGAFANWQLRRYVRARASKNDKRPLLPPDEDHLANVREYHETLRSQEVLSLLVRQGRHEALVKGRKALERGDWGRAQAFFETAFDNTSQLLPEKEELRHDSKDVSVNETLRWGLVASDAVANCADDAGEKAFAQQLHATLCFVTGRFAECMVTATSMAEETPGKWLFRTLSLMFLLGDPAFGEGQGARKFAPDITESHVFQEMTSKSVLRELRLATGLGFYGIGMNDELGTDAQAWHKGQAELLEEKIASARDIAYHSPRKLKWAEIEGLTDPILAMFDSAFQKQLSWRNNWWGLYGHNEMNLINRRTLEQLITLRVWLETWRRVYEGRATEDPLFQKVEHMLRVEANVRA